MDAQVDVQAMLCSLRLQTIRRYFDQQHWTTETALARAADEVESGLKLENVAAHSWHVADAALLIGPRFPSLQLDRVVKIAILHDKLELITGDRDPVGEDGQGNTSHAFNAEARQQKLLDELGALECYLSNIGAPAKTLQQDLLLDSIHGRSIEAKFVKAIDKLQALIFVIEKKRGDLSDEHIAFSLRYSSKAVEYYPSISVHYGVLIRLFLKTISDRRGSNEKTVLAALSSNIRALGLAYL
jgi:putative hydrolase of HD superfamily